MQEYGLPTMSEDTIGSSVYWRIPAQWSDAAAELKASFTSAAVAGLSRTQTRSVMLPSGTGRAAPSRPPSPSARG